MKRRKVKSSELISAVVNSKHSKPDNNAGIHLAYTRCKITSSVAIFASTITSLDYMTANNVIYIFISPIMVAINILKKCNAPLVF